jgi:hypothetical protein
VHVWLKNIGASGDRIKSKRWYDEGSDEGEFRWHIRFSEQYAGKSIVRGDVLLYHAFVEGLDEGRVVGVARVSSDAPIFKPRSNGDQWPWWRGVTPLLIVPLAGHAPSLKDIGIETAPMGGYKEISPTALSEAVGGLAANALPHQ